MRALGWWADRTGVVGGLGLMCLLVALVITPFGLYQRIHDDSFRRHAAHATGTVVAQEDTGSRGGGTKLTVDFSVDGHAYTFTQGATNQHVDGRQEGVLYDPRDPSHAELADTGLGDSQLEYNLMFVFGGAFVLCTILGLLFTLVGRSWRRRRAPATPAISPTPPPYAGPSLFDEPRP